jgi:hypothetical protein
MLLVGALSLAAGACLLWAALKLPAVSTSDSQRFSFLLASCAGK